MRSYRGFAHLVVLTVAAALLLVLTAYKAEQNAQRLARYKERDFRLKAAYELGSEAADRLRMAFRAHVTVEVFEEDFGPITELTDVRDPKDGETRYSYVHDGSQRTFHLRFRDGRLVGAGSGPGTDDIDAGVVLETPAFLRTEAVRGTVLGGSLVAWCLVLVTGICVRRFRRNAAVVLVVLSTVCGLCWLLAPNYAPTLKGISSNDSLAVFAFMLICSLAFAAVTLLVFAPEASPRLKGPEEWDATEHLQPPVSRPASGVR